MTKKGETRNDKRVETRNDKVETPRESLWYSALQVNKNVIASPDLSGRGNLITILP